MDLEEATTTEQPSPAQEVTPLKFGNSGDLLGTALKLPATETPPTEPAAPGGEDKESIPSDVTIPEVDSSQPTAEPTTAPQAETESELKVRLEKLEKEREAEKAARQYEANRQSYFNQYQKVLTDIKRQESITNTLQQQYVSTLENYENSDEIQRAVEAWVNGNPVNTRIIPPDIVDLVNAFSESVNQLQQLSAHRDSYAQQYQEVERRNYTSKIETDLDNLLKESGLTLAELKEVDKNLDVTKSFPVFKAALVAQAKKKDARIKELENERDNMRKNLEKEFREKWGKTSPAAYAEGGNRTAAATPAQPLRYGQSEELLAKGMSKNKK